MTGSGRRPDMEAILDVRESRNPMRFNPLGCCRMAAALLAGAVLATPALAGLGGSADSVTADMAALRGQQLSTPFVQYDRHQITTSNGVVSEYVTRGGQVFAITWQGRIPPNLQQLLGNYFTRIQAARAAQGPRPGRHSHFSVVQSDLVFVNTGHMGAFRGIAYLPALVPEGVSVGELQ